MTTKNIIQKGDIAKYQIKIQRDDFDVERDDFSVTLRWGIASPDSMKIEKTDMYHDEEWNVYFMFETSGMLGKVTAECEYKVPDSDAQGGYRTSVDRQILCLVADNANCFCITFCMYTQSVSDNPLVKCSLCVMLSCGKHYRKGETDSA